MPDIIDVNTGTVIDGEETIEQAGERILDYVIRVASGEEDGRRAPRPNRFHSVEARA